MELDVERAVPAASNGNGAGGSHLGDGRARPPRPARNGEWSDSALRVLNERYLLKENGVVVETPEEMCWRVAWAIAQAETTPEWSQDPKTREQVALAFYDLLIERKFLPNSPTLMNAGKGNNLQYSACFVLPVPDDLKDIFRTMEHAALIHQSGGGTGFAFSRLRPKGDIVKRSGGTASGPVSFLRVYNAATEAVKQGGTRRGANMGILKVDHPDILEFIDCKNDGGITNFNISVAITDTFMRALETDGEYDLINPATNQVTGRLKARTVWNKVVDSAWRTGDPGLVFIDRINKSPANPVPELETIEATNPCVVGETRLATSRGLSRVDELYRTQEQLSVATDARVPGQVVTELVHAGGAALALAPPSTGVIFHQAAPIFKTGTNVPVLKLTTSHGIEITATPYHKFLTPGGYKPLEELEYGDTLLLQSGAGAWSSDRTLPSVKHGAVSAARLRGKIRRGEAEPPTEWSEDLGEVFGYLLGDGWIRRDKTADVLGVAIDGQDESVTDIIRERLQRWFGAPGCAAERQGHLQLTYKGTPATFFEALGLTKARAHEKRVPESIFAAPRDAVIGFLRGLFSADGMVNIGPNNHGSCSVRLATSSKGLAQDVQQLLLNFGIVGSIKLRRNAAYRMMPDAQRNLAEYYTQAQYELILDRANRDHFVEQIGFLQERKQWKARAWIQSKQKRSDKETFVTRVASVEPAGTADVYCTTEPRTHSIIVNGLTTAQCGEQPLAPNDACNLGSISLAQVVKDGQVDWDELDRITRLGVRFLDDVIQVNPYPLPQIQEEVHNNRRIGLGVMGWADMLFKLGIPYDSEEALELGARVMERITRVGHEASEQLAEVRGPFPNWTRSIYRDGKPLRNSTVTTIAPTGTISIIADASSGIEPIFALAFQHKVGDRVLTFVNPFFVEEAKRRGIYSEDLMERVSAQGAVHGLEGVPEDMQRIFVTAHEIEPRWHVKMQAAFQRYTDNGTSKTINLPNKATPGDVEEAYNLAWSSGCLGITVFRDGCKGVQVLNVGVDEKKEKTAEPSVEERATQAPLPGLPAIRARGRKLTGETHKIRTPVGTAYVTVNMDDYGEPLEAFVNIGSSGSDVTAVAEALGRLISLVLRTPSPLTQREKIAEIVDQLSGIGGGRSLGFGAQRVLSLPDALAQVLAEYCEKEQEEIAQPGLLPDPSLKGDICPTCGWAAFVHEEGCKKCHFCGFSEC